MPISIKKNYNYYNFFSHKNHAANKYTYLMNKILGKYLTNGILQNHRMVGVGRDLCGSSSPTPLPKQGRLQQVMEDKGKDNYRKPCNRLHCTENLFYTS